MKGICVHVCVFLWVEGSCLRSSCPVGFVCGVILQLIREEGGITYPCGSRKSSLGGGSSIWREAGVFRSVSCLPSRSVRAWFLESVVQLHVTCPPSHTSPILPATPYLSSQPYITCPPNTAYFHRSFCVLCTWRNKSCMWVQGPKWAQEGPSEHLFTFLLTSCLCIPDSLLCHWIDKINVIVVLSVITMF